MRKVPTEEKMRETMLKFFNGILKNIKGVNHIDITDITEFKDIDRNDIVNLQANSDLLKAMQDEIIGSFSKQESGYYGRNKRKDYILTVMRYMLKSLGYKISRRKIDITHPVENCSRGIRRSHYLFSIILK